MNRLVELGVNTAVEAVENVGGTTGSAVDQQAEKTSASLSSTAPSMLQSARRSIVAGKQRYLDPALGAAGDALAAHAPKTRAAASCAATAAAASAAAAAPVTHMAARFSAQAAATLAARQQIDPLAQRLLEGCAIYSRNFLSDLWLVTKNEHIVLSLLLCHPSHAFGAGSRLAVLLVSCAAGLGLTYLLAQIADETLRTVVSVLFGALVQGVYDGLLKTFATCGCAEGARCGVRFAARCAGALAITAQALLGLLLLLLGALLLARQAGGGSEEASEELSGEEVSEELVRSATVSLLRDATVTFAVAKLESFFIVSLLFLTALFARDRRRQIRPDGADALAVWRQPVVTRGLCGRGAPRGTPPRSATWDRWIGADVSYAELPARAPRYARTVCCCVQLAGEPCTSESPLVSPAEMT